MNAQPRHLSYHFEGYDEACLCLGNEEAPRRILVVPALFDEMNRVRSVVVGAMRQLAEHGVMTLLPDLPGCNESLADISTQSLDSWREAVTAAGSQFQASHVASIRGGTLVADRLALPQWRLASVKGSSLLKTMLRTRIAADKEAGKNNSVESLMAEARMQPVELSGYRLGAAMLAALETAIANPDIDAQEIVLGQEPGMLCGTPIWLRAEPKDDPAMSAALAFELDRWSATCGR
ncbi:MAG: hypothetical protein WBO17_11325 [Sphingorhabdus sp.]